MTFDDTHECSYCGEYLETDDEYCYFAETKRYYHRGCMEQMEITDLCNEVNVNFEYLCELLGGHAGTWDEEP